MGNNKVNIIWVKGVFIALLACFYITLSAQTDTVDIIAPSVVSSREAVDFRIPDKSKIEKYNEDSRFDYTQVERKASLWDKIRYKIFEYIGKLFSSVAQSGVPGIAVIIVIVLVVCLIMLKVLGVNYRTILGKKAMDTPEIDIYSENVHEMDFDTLIANAIKNKDYRLVVRFLYLKNLKLLSDKEIIEWKTNKTNYSYQHEINNNTIRSKFLEATLIFDYVWYGEISPDEVKFSEIHRRMNDFSKMISNEK